MKKKHGKVQCEKHCAAVEFSMFVQHALKGVIIIYSPSNVHRTKLANLANIVAAWCTYANKHKYTGILPDLRITSKYVCLQSIPGIALTMFDFNHGLPKI